VTSPNGTTEKAITVMSDAKLEAMFTEATSAALARAKELAGE
jgi:pyrroline-5-carboxylate reductase